jgi:hypothetical protein
MNLAEALMDDGWNKQREELENKVIAAVTELALFSGACRMELPREGMRVVIEVKRTVQ